ncbi:MAG: HAD family hydrolase [Candidatus Binatia bacterium]
MIRAVLFDYGGVITEGMAGLLIPLTEGSGATLPEIGALLLGAYHEDGDYMWHRLERGEVTFQATCAWARDEASQRGWTLDLSPLPRLLAELPLRPGMIDRIRALRAEGIRTGLVTNNVREFGVSWKTQLAFDELFDVVVDSCETGLRKPDRRIYELALERLGTKAEDAVFLDDFTVNVEGARRVGMQAILVGDDWRAAVAELDAILGAEG